MNSNIETKINVLPPFKYFVNSIGELPSSYLESMSYYETLVWLLNYLKETIIPTVNNTGNAVTELQNLYLQLENYVNTYFDNLDVQEEINNKLDAMTESGELITIISNYLNPFIEEQNSRINEFIESTNETLVEQNNIINSVSSGTPKGVYATLLALQTANPNHNYIYVVEADGYWYYYNTTSNEWTRGLPYQGTTINNDSISFYKLKNNAVSLSNNNGLSEKLKKYNTINRLLWGTSVITGATGVNRFSINDNNTKTSFMYIDINKNNLVTLIDNLNYKYYVQVYEYVNKTNNAYLFDDVNFEVGGINENGNNEELYGCFRCTDYFEVDDKTKIELDKNLYNIRIIEYNQDNTVHAVYTYNPQVNTDDIPTDFSTDYKYKIAFYLSSRSVDISDGLNQFVTYLKSNKLTTSVGQLGGVAWKTYNHSIQAHLYNSGCYRICLRANNSSNLTNVDANDIIATSDNINSPIYNKFISILGDSISSYVGEIPEDNAVYYNGSNAGVSNPHQMWWYRLIDNNGANKGIIEASSGSNVSNIRGNVIPMSDTSRCENLRNGANNPDIIIIEGGTNDFSHTPSLLGDFNGTSDFPTSNMNFADAYALMLSRILETYPNACVFCCSLPIFVRTNTNKAQNEKNTETDNTHKTVYDYNEKIKNIAEIMSCKYIDLNKVGYTRENYYNVYCQDNANTPTHPNAKGQEALYKVVEDEIIKVLNSTI